MNKLYYGDNLEIMKNRLKDESVDLIYLDPPFNSNKNYNLMYKTLTGKPVPESVEAFCDTWTLDSEKEQKARDMPALMHEHGIHDDYAQFWKLWIKALRKTQPDLLAYLIYMVERLIYMRLILKPTGSLYLHCDPTASHYIKVMCDAIFGHKNFRNEIIWCYRQGGRSAKRFSSKHDVLLFYTKTKNWIFNADSVRIKYHGTGGYVSTGRNIIAGKEYKINPKGKIPEDWWDIPALNPMATERLGYPTQKPIALLDRIIRASSNEGDVVFDPFCGSGTTIYSAVKNNRQWIGCDIAILSIMLIKEVLHEREKLVEGMDFEING